MWVKRNLTKIGLGMSFLTAIAYELTGSNSIRVISAAVGLISLSILISHISDLKQISRIRELVHHIRFLR